MKGKQQTQETKKQSLETMKEAHEVTDSFVEPESQESFEDEGVTSLVEDLEALKVQLKEAEEALQRSVLENVQLKQMALESSQQEKDRDRANGQRDAKWKEMSSQEELFYEDFPWLWKRFELLNELIEQQTVALLGLEQGLSSLQQERRQERQREFVRGYHLQMRELVGEDYWERIRNEGFRRFLEQQGYVKQFMQDPRAQNHANLLALYEHLKAAGKLNKKGKSDEASSEAMPASMLESGIGGLKQGRNRQVAASTLVSHTGGVSKPKASGEKSYFELWEEHVVQPEKVRR